MKLYRPAGTLERGQILGNHEMLQRQHRRYNGQLRSLLLVILLPRFHLKLLYIHTVKILYKIFLFATKRLLRAL